MKYVVTESQYNLIKEIGRQAGHYDASPLENFYEYMDEQIPRKQKVKLFKDFFEGKMGLEFFDDEFLLGDVLGYFDNPLTSEWNKEFKTKDARSGFAYYAAKKYFGLKEKYGLYYLVNKVRGGMRIFYFFDPTLKIFVGRILIDTDSDLPKNIFRVKLSAADEDLVGTGYGTRMYLIVIDNVDYLASDTVLFSGSYRMWKHTLPNYVNVWGIIGNEYYGWNKTVKMDDNVKSVRKFDYFIASSNHNKLK